MFDLREIKIYMRHLQRQKNIDIIRFMMCWKEINIKKMRDVGGHMLLENSVFVCSFLKGRTWIPLKARTCSPLMARTCSPLKTRVCSPLMTRTCSPLMARACSPLKVRTCSPLKVKVHDPLKVRT